MGVTLQMDAYDLSDESPGRTLNEDATLVRPDLGLFAVADGAGGRGKGNVAAQLALRTMENFIGATVRKTHERPDFDVLGLPEQAKRLSAAIHRAHHNLLDVIAMEEERAGMATTVVAALFSPRTHELHVGHVGDSRLYRLRHGRLELITEDHTIATDILERKPEVPDDVLETLPRNSVVRALGMDDDFRVSIRTLQLLPGDRFLLCSDGLSSVVPAERLWQVLRQAEPPATLASELLSHALAQRAQDNISVLVLDCEEKLLDDALPTQRYNEIPSPPVSPRMAPSESQVEITELDGFGKESSPEIVPQDVVGELDDSASPFDDVSALGAIDVGPADLEDLEANEDGPRFVETESEAPTHVYERSSPKPAPPTQTSSELPRNRPVLDVDPESLEIEQDPDDVPLDFDEDESPSESQR